jgi:RHS repeat-associated protein
LRWRDGNCDGDYADEGDSVLYYCNDANFNVTALVDTDGNAVERYTYTPYGQVTVCDGSWSPRENNVSAYSNEILFTGHRLDPETGLYDAGFRFYHPTLGRFILPDPQQGDGGSFEYQYVDSQPTSAVDPYGLWKQVEGEPNIYVPETDGESLEALVTKVASDRNTVANWVCIRPKPEGLSEEVAKKMETYYANKTAPLCGKYDVGNLVDAWPVGSPSAPMYSLFAQGEPTGTRTRGFVERHRGKGSLPQFTREQLAASAGNGSTPLAGLLLAGHCDNGETYISSALEGKIQKYGLNEILGNIDQGNYTDAVAGKFPPLCWFRHDAVVILQACCSEAFAAEWATRVLRKGAQAWGTTGYINWTARPAGMSHPFFSSLFKARGKTGPVYEEIEPFLTDPNWWVRKHGER